MMFQIRDVKLSLIEEYHSVSIQVLVVRVALMMLVVSILLNLEKLWMKMTLNFKLQKWVK